MVLWSFSFSSTWSWIAAACAVAASLVAAGHAVLYKRDDRGTTLWIVLICSLPLIGPALYVTFGINRIQRRAAALRRRAGGRRGGESLPRSASCSVEDLLGSAGAYLTPLTKVVENVAGCPLLPGNLIEPLVNGDTAYPAMLSCIAAARHSVTLATYIFEADAVGLKFAEALGEAVRRGIEVRVLVDATGTLLTPRSMVRPLRRQGIRFARFLPAIALGQPVSLNLRNHRKLLVVDGNIGFTGGMNLCVGHMRRLRPTAPIDDVHFRLRGPVVAQLQEAFVEDWFFTTRERLEGPRWFPRLEPVGVSAARGVASGPDENFEKSRWTLLGAISLARRSLRIVTPYFLPDTALRSALNLAAMRGVEVDIFLPQKGDVAFVQWASAAHWWQLLEHGCRIWLTPPPFDHAKLFVVDDTWLFFGSSNWDVRSLRLNFEFDVECYDPAVAQQVVALIDRRHRRARQVTLAEVNHRPLPIRLRNGFARLFAPFL